MIENSYGVTQKLMSEHAPTSLCGALQSKQATAETSSSCCIPASWELMMLSASTPQLPYAVYNRCQQHMFVGTGEAAACAHHLLLLLP